MAYLSKKAILGAYAELSKLTSDPSAQGATQITSALRYMFALDEFTKKFGRDCDTSNKEDREIFISFVGNVVSINKDYYTANFFNAIKDNPDYAVGSNFFSVNVVKNSVVNPNTDFSFPKRGNNPLFIVKGGRLIEKSELLSNLKEYLHTPILQNAFAVWLMRYEQVNSEDIFGSFVSGLTKRYSEGLIKELQIDKTLILQFIGNSLIDNPYLLSVSDFPTATTKEKKPTVEILPTEDLIDKVRNSFTHFVHLINTHTNDFTGYISKFEEFINPKLTNIYPEYSNIFQIVDIEILHAIIAKLKEVDPSLENVFTTEYKGTQYQAFRTMKYYEMYLDILADSDFQANITRNKEDRLAVATATSAIADNHIIRAMRTKPFLLLAGISGTGKSRIVKQMAFDSCPDNNALSSDLTSPGNYCLIEVKPNWHDSTELLGYESKIGGAHYQLTPFVKFLAKAMLYPDVPFFVCLDEMNLAPVEQYFAEFLSVLESRTKIDGHIVSEPLIKADIFKKYNLEKSLFSKEEAETNYGDEGTSDPAETYGPENEVYKQLKEHGLRIPENVIVIGTVNMDETTHQFSRKVIDRAMTIEMNLPEGDPFMDFFANASELEYRTAPTSPSLYLATETKASEVVKALAADNADKTEWLKGEVAKLLTAINAALEGTPFKVAYRVQNELMLYFYQLWLEDKSDDWATLLYAAVDQILMMKVLPRVEGDEELLEKPLDRLIEFSQSYPNASKKLAEMKSRLGQSQFTSFWP